MTFHCEIDIQRDHSYFTKLGKSEALAQLTHHERKGSLKDFLKEVAPDYLSSGGEAMVFTLVQDLGY